MAHWFRQFVSHCHEFVKILFSSSKLGLGILELSNPMGADLSLHDTIRSELIATFPRFEEPGSAPSFRKLDGYRALVTVVSSAIYLYLNLFTLTGTPFLLDGDQVYFWTYALRVLHGERIYQDFFTMHPPGASLFYAALFALFGARIWVTNFVALALGVALCWLGFRIANTFMEGEAALSATAMFLVAVYGKLLNGTHHWFSVLAVLGAVALVLSGSEMRRIAGAGVLLGVASFFTRRVARLHCLGFAYFCCGMDVGTASPGRSSCELKSS